MRDARLSHAEIAAQSASARTAAERRRWQVIGLLADGTPLAEIVAATGYRPRTIRQIAQRYRAAGPAGLVDGRQRSLGAVPLLSVEQQDELRAALQGVPPDGGRWSGPKVARWIECSVGARDAYESTPMRRASAYLGTLTTASHWCIVRPSGNGNGSDDRNGRIPIRMKPPSPSASCLHPATGCDAMQQPVSSQ